MSLLEGGQKIGLVATANPVTPELNSSLEYALKFFHRVGLKPILGVHALEQARPNETLVDATMRAEDVNSFARDAQIKAIVNLWGGYDSADLLPHLDWGELGKKTLIGASDFTTILNAVHHETGIASYLWANAIWLGLDVYRESEVTFEQYFMQNKGNQDKDLFVLDEPQVLKNGRGVGTLVGGNLQTFDKLLGTRYFPQPKNPILVIEDVEHSVHQVRAKIERLIHAHFFNNGQGLIFGNIMNSGKNISPELQREIIGLMEQYSFPIIFSPHIGHNVGNEVIPIGRQVSIDTSSGKYILVP